MLMASPAASFDGQNFPILQGVEVTGVELGRGSFGRVIEAEYACTPCAAKELHSIFREAQPPELESIKSKFIKECNVWSKVRHPNIVQFIGVYYSGGSNSGLPMIVMEKMQFSLRRYYESVPESATLDMKRKLSILQDVSMGLCYLHAQKLVHRDLSPNNILLGGDGFKAKITDLGMTKVIMQLRETRAIASKSKHTVGPGTPHFMPPEALYDNPQYGPSLDIFSYGGVILYTVTHQWPEPSARLWLNPHTEKPELVPEVYRRSKYLEMMKECCADLIPLATICLADRPSERPSISDVCIDIKDLISKQPSGESSVVPLSTRLSQLYLHEEKSPAEMLRCCGPTDSRDIAPGKPGIASEDPITVPQFFKQACEKFPNVKALCWKGSKERKDMFLRYADYKKLVYDVAKSFHKLGLESHRGVGILGFNSVEWFASSLGAVFAGGLPTGMYTTSSPKTCHYILENCKANIVVVENKEQLDKILEIRQRLTHLKAIIQYKGELSKRYPKTYTWKEFLEVGKGTEDSVIDDIIDKQQPNQCAVLVYTSGTTGNPKGVMLSHDNLTWITKALMDTQQEPKLTCGGQERSVSYLPLAHIAGMIADIYLPILINSTVYIAQPDALKEKDSLRHTMKEAIPTYFLGVPRLWERMKEMIDEHVANSNNPIVKYFFRWGTKENHSQSGWKYAVAKITVFKQVQKKAGLHMCKHIFVGSAPMHQATFEFFKSLNISISELYGLTECSGLHSIKFKSATQSKPKSCGKQLNGVETNIIECGVDEHNRGEGQVLIRGRHVFIGYLGMEKETREAIDDDGWLHSGDIGYRDDDNFLYITGRIKELISFPIINPNPIEDRIKTEIPFLSNVVVVGDNREFLTCLLTLKCTTNNNGEATDDLQSKVIKMFRKKLGSHCVKASEVYDTKDKAVFQAIGEGIRRYNMASRAHQVIRKFQLLPTDFTTRGGELGPTLKIQRQAIQKKYKKFINDMYT